MVVFLPTACSSLMHVVPSCVDHALTMQTYSTTPCSRHHDTHTHTHTHTSQADNVIVKTWGTKRPEDKLYNHVDLVQLLDLVDLEAGSSVAGV